MCADLQRVLLGPMQLLPLNSKVSYRHCSHIPIYLFKSIVQDMNITMHGPLSMHKTVASLQPRVVCLYLCAIMMSLLRFKSMVRHMRIKLH